MAGPDIALGLIGAVDVVIKCGKTLINTCSAFNHADDEIRRRIVRVELCWKKTSLQLELLRRVWEELDQQLQELQEEILTIFTTTLSAVNSKLNGFVKDQSLGSEAIASSNTLKTKKREKAKYALLKGYLDGAINDMESWQRRFDPSWYLILRIPSEHINKELQGPFQENRIITSASRIRDSLIEAPSQKLHVILPEDELGSSRMEQVPLGTAKLMYRAESTKPLILDVIPCYPTVAFGERRKAICNLARKLKNADPSSLALLKCHGVVASKACSQFTLVFKAPDGMDDPKSLRTCLVSGEPVHSLSDRFRLATQLATAVCSVHTFGFVHKSIRPENIILFRNQHSSIGAGYLLGFERVRPDEGQTRFTGDQDWEKNIYRHPQRQGLNLQDRYVMQHDIYSLGVCLLEIGLWASFVHYPESFSNPTESKEYNFSADSQTGVERAESVKSKLLALALNSLPSCMGDKYAKVVQTCLICLDEGCDDFGDESDFQDEDGVLVAVRYIEKVLLQLNNISV